MKKVFALVAVVGFALAFAACGKKAEEAATTEGGAQQKQKAPWHSTGE